MNLYHIEEVIRKETKEQQTEKKGKMNKITDIDEEHNYH